MASRSTSPPEYSRPTRRRWTAGQRVRRVFDRLAYLAVHAERQHNLWRTVPTSRDVCESARIFLTPAYSTLTLGEALLLWVGRLDGLGGSGETEIAHLEIAIGIEQQIGRLEVSVDD